MDFRFKGILTEKIVVCEETNRLNDLFLVTPVGGIKLELSALLMTMMIVTSY